jgi:hypothetical protein
MGKLVFGMMQSLDGYVDGVAGWLELPPTVAAPGVTHLKFVRRSDAEGGRRGDLTQTRRAVDCQ